MQQSLAVRNAKLDAMADAVGPSPVLRIRTGPMPANTAAADAGTTLATLNLPTVWMAPAANGLKVKAGTWGDDAADAAGIAGFYRLYENDGATCHFQGLVSMPWAASTAVVVGQQMSLAGNVYRASAAGTTAASGGPSGTGGTIADGGVTWAYIGPAGLVVDNVNFAVGQQVSIDTYSWAAGNA